MLCPHCKQLMTDPHTLLTARQLQMCVALASGKKPKQIAYEMGLVHQTVSLHLRVAKQKIGVRNDLELTRYAIDRGLVK